MSWALSIQVLASTRKRRRQRAIGPSGRFQNRGQKPKRRLSALFPRKPGGTGISRGGEAITKIGIVGKSPDRFGNGFGLERIKKETTLSQDLGHGSTTRRGNRQAGRHRFEQNVRQVLTARSKDKEVGRVITLRQGRVLSRPTDGNERPPRIEPPERAAKPTTGFRIRVPHEFDRDRHTLTPQLRNRLCDAPLMFVDVDDRHVEDSHRSIGGIVGKRSLPARRMEKLLSHAVWNDGRSARKWTGRAEDRVLSKLREENHTVRRFENCVAAGDAIRRAGPTWRKDRNGAPLAIGMGACCATS